MKLFILEGKVIKSYYIEEDDEKIENIYIVMYRGPSPFRNVVGLPNNIVNFKDNI